jgi:hypothetical protein
MTRDEARRGSPSLSRRFAKLPDLSAPGATKKAPRRSTSISARNAPFPLPWEEQSNIDVCCGCILLKRDDMEGVFYFR